MKIEVYSKDNCPYCTMAKELLQNKGLQYEEHVVGSTISRNDFLEKFPGVKTVPQILVNGQRIGGYDKLTEWVKLHDSGYFLT